MWRGATTTMAERSLCFSITCLFNTVATWVIFIHGTNGIPWTQEKFHHRAVTLTSDEIRTALSHTNLDQMWQRDLRPLLVTRYPGSAGSQAVQQHIKTTLSSLGAGWEVTEDGFVSQTPYGPLPFTNIIATLNPSAKRRLVLACHYDSKYYPPQYSGKEFQGATDSAVPCAMMLELARALDEELKTHKLYSCAAAEFPLWEINKELSYLMMSSNHGRVPVNQTSSSDLTLQMLFFDGEEALFQWTATDSLYGSRHLAEKMEATPHPAETSDTNQLHGIDLFVLLDLIGAPSPRFGSQFVSTQHWLTRLQNIERRLHSMNTLTDHPNNVQYFWPNVPVGRIEDDHIPFLIRGVSVLHLIPSPFPSVWHTFDDDEQNLDRTVIENLNKILQVFVLEYLNARPQTSNPHNAP